MEFVLLIALVQDPKTPKDIELASGWIKDDLSAGLALAKKENKPVLVVFR